MRSLLVLWLEFKRRLKGHDLQFADRIEEQMTKVAISMGLCPICFKATCIDGEHEGPTKVTPVDTIITALRDIQAVESAEERVDLVRQAWDKGDLTITEDDDSIRITMDYIVEFMAYQMTEPELEEIRKLGYKH